MVKKLSTDKLRKAATTARRSSLYLWMLENFDTFSAAVSEAGRPNWGALAETFGAEGLRDLKGKPPSPEGTRQTWWKVRKAVAKGRSGGTQRAVTASQDSQKADQPPAPAASRKSPAQAEGANQPPSLTQDVADEEDPPATRPSFQYGKLR
jgi:hypothetical protein